jgi:hypothetical protein
MPKGLMFGTIVYVIRNVYKNALECLLKLLEKGSSIALELNFQYTIFILANRTETYLSSSERHVIIFRASKTHQSRPLDVLEPAMNNLPLYMKVRVGDADTFVDLRH